MKTIPFTEPRAPGEAALCEPELLDFESVSEYFTALDNWERPYVDALLGTRELIRPIAGICDWNGPSGRLLGQRILQECSFRGKQIRDWSIAEFADLCERVGREYDELQARRRDAGSLATG